MRDERDTEQVAPAAAVDTVGDVERVARQAETGRTDDERRRIGPNVDPLRDHTNVSDRWHLVPGQAELDSQHRERGRQVDSAGAARNRDWIDLSEHRRRARGQGYASPETADCGPIFPARTGLRDGEVAETAREPAMIS